MGIRTAWICSWMRSDSSHFDGNLAQAFGQQRPGFSQVFRSMWALCAELWELIVGVDVVDDVESCSDAELDEVRHQRQISFEYDPEKDDYEMSITPESPEKVELEEKQLIIKQLRSLQNRMAAGGQVQSPCTNVCGSNLSDWTKTNPNKTNIKENI